MRGGGTDRGREGLQGLLRGFAHELHAAADLEFGEQGRNVELDSALGEIEFGGDFLIRETAKNAIQNLFLAACQPDTGFDAVAGIEQFLSLVGQPLETFRGGWDHDEVIARGLSAHHAVHGEQAGGVIDGEFAGRPCLDMEMGGP